MSALCRVVTSSSLCLLEAFPSQDIPKHFGSFDKRGGCHPINGVDALCLFFDFQSGCGQ